MAKGKGKGPGRPRKEPPPPAVEAADIDLDDDEDGDEDQDRDADGSIAALFDAISAGDSGTRVEVTKVLPKEEAGLCDPYPGAEFSIERLRADWGHGKFILIAKTATGKFLRRRTVELARAPVRIKPVEIDSAAVKREAREELQATMAPMLKMMETAFGALAGRPASAPSTDPLQILDMVQRMHSMSQPKSGKDVDTLLQGIKLAKELGSGGGGGGESGVADVAIKFMETFGGQLNNGPPGAPAQAALPSPSNGDAQPTEVNMFGVMSKMIADKIPMLLTAAAKGTEPTIYAQVLIDQIPSQFQGFLFSQLNKPDWFDTLARLDGRVAPHQQWLTSMRDAIIEAAIEAGAIAAPATPIDAPIEPAKGSPT